MTKSELKDIIKECIEEIQLEETFDIEEAAKIYEECLLYESFSEYDVESIEEGANLDSRAIFKKAKAEIKSAMKTAKKETKAGNYDEAHKCIAKAKKALKECEEAIKDTDSDAGSAIFGYFATGLLTICEIFLPYTITLSGATIALTGGVLTNLPVMTLGSTIAAGGYLALVVKSLTAIIKDIKQFIETLKDPKANIEDKLNGYKMKLLRYCKDIENNLDKTDKAIDEAKEKKAKK